MSPAAPRKTSKSNAAIEGSFCDQAVRVTCDNQVFVRGHDAYDGAARVVRDDRCVLRVAPGVEVDPEMAEMLADARANCRRAFADACREHKRVQTTERCRERAD